MRAGFCAKMRMGKLNFDAFGWVNFSSPRQIIIKNIGSYDAQIRV